MTDPVTGQTNTKKKLGGSYPGMSAPHHKPYAPPASAFQNGTTAQAHFIQYGNGNALTLVQNDGSSQPQSGGPESQYVQVTLPDGVYAGQKIHVKAPDGRINEIIVPNGFGPGSVFTVEFAPEHEAPSSYNSMPSNKIPSEQAAAFNNTRPNNNYGGSAPSPANNNNNYDGVDDGFASGFNNANWRPPRSQQQAQAQPVYTTNTMSVEPDIDLNSYPTSEAVPVSGYSDPPQYSSK